MKKILFLFLLLLCTQILFAERYQEYDNGSYFITDQTIQGYSSNYSGGAVKITQTADLTIDNSIFYNNKTYYIVSSNDTNGGAVFNEGNLYFNTNNYSAFLYNTATEPSSCGGAIYNAANAQVYAVFENNTAPYGGAIFNEGNLKILADDNGNVYNFSSNVSSTHTYSYDGKTYGGYAGAVFNSSVTTTGNRVLFHDNSSSLHGGAIYNVGTDSIFNIGSNNLFYENHSSSGGAISANSGRVNISNNVVFATNTATKAGGAMYVAESAVIVSSSSNGYIYNTAENGGAIYNEGRVILGTLDGTEASAFIGNKSAVGGAITNKGVIGFNDPILFSQNNAELIGGAIVNDNVNDNAYIVFNNVSGFENNSANVGGGAIYNSSATIYFIKETAFENNSANKAGGAIFNSNGSDSNIEFASNAIFSNNSVTGDSSAGGAIFNGKDSVIKFSGGAIFTNNSATSYGGAIANAGTLDLFAYGNNIEFTGNTVNGVSNAIYDERGTINLQSYSNADIIFNDSIASADDTSILNIDCYDRGKVLLNEDMNGYTGFVNLNYGSLEIKEGKKFFNTDKFTIYNGTFTANANSILKGFGNINGFVHLTGGTNNSSITGDGKTIIDGNVVNNSFLGNSILINENKQLETSASNLLQEIENRGNLILNAGNLDINSTITGAGTLFISGDVKSYKTINQSSVTVSQKLTNYNKIQTAEYINNGTTINSSTISATRNFVNDGSLTNTNLIETEKFVAKENGTVDNTGTIKTKILNIAENAVLNNAILNGFEIQSYIDNEGTLTFENGTINNIIKGTGNTIINGNIVNNGQVSETNLTINNGKELETNVSRIIKNNIENNGNLILKGNSYLTDNMNFIQGTGTTIIDGYIVNMSTISNKVTINEDKFLRSDADDINGNITNNGQLAFNYTGTNKNIITGTGTLFIEGVISNDNNIEQDYSRIFSDKELKNNSTIKTNKIFQIDSNAKVINDGELLISSGTNNGKIERTNNSSQTKIYGNFVNNGTIDQFEFYVRENGKVQNNNTISADIIGNYGNLETSATNIAGGIINNGTLSFNAGTENNNSISGLGNLNITANNLTNNDSIEQNTVRISKDNVNNLNFANSQLNAQQELNKFVNNSKIKSENLNLSSVNLKLTEKGILETDNLFAQNSEIDFANSILQQHNFKSINVSLSDTLNLSVDADLENKQMDTISAESFAGSGKINVKAINILADAKEEQTEVVFTTSTVLKNKITSINTVNSKLFKYDVDFNKDTGNFNFLLTTKANPVIAESAIASSVGGFTTQTNVLGQAFASIDTQISSRHLVKQKSVLYASAPSSIFDMENKIERGLWIRPYAVSETIKFNDVDVDNTAIGTLAGLDLVAGENILLSFYLGYAGSNQKYEDIKVNQMGYIIGATGMIIKEKWYAGLTANVNFNKAESQSDYGTDNFDMNMYSIGAKAGYNFDLSDKWILEPNLMLMYGNVTSQEYETTQGAKIDSQSTANIIAEPQVKAKLSLDNGWQPYGLLGYVANISDTEKIKVENTEFETDEINGYVEYGAGVNKDFINTPWSCYLQATGRSGGRTGFAGNLGVKYRF